MNEPFAPLTPNPTRGGAPPKLLDRPRTSRLLRPTEFRAVYDKGMRFSGPLFAAFCLARPDAGRTTARLGITIPRAVGKAVVRNRIKRRFREAFRLHRSEIGTQWDIVLNPRKAASTVEWNEIERAFRKVIEKCAV
jgi:ribonuclease P protein component